MTNPLEPRPEHHFTFGLWTVGNRGRDPFGHETRPPLDPVESVHRLAELGAYGVNFHDDDLVPFDATPAERSAIVDRFRAALDATGMKVPMATTNLFSHPVFRDGAFTSSDPRVRAFAVQKAMHGIELGVELGARTIVFWGGREGAETDACRDPRDAIAWYRECLNVLCHWTRSQGWDLRFALEAKPNEPRGDIYLPTTGHMLHFIQTLDHPQMCGVNPEVAHETMAGLNFLHAVAQAMECGKLFHVDLNAQRIGKFDQDLRFGSEDLKGAFFLVRMLEGCSGRPAYEGPRHFDAHAYRTEDPDGVWDFARGCMRTYKVLAAKARAFDADPEVRAIIAGNAFADEPLGCAAMLSATQGAGASRIRALALDPDAIAARGHRYERLDQLAMEHLMGVRG